MAKTKVLLVGAGAGYSTKDLEMGYYEAFEDLDVELYFYLLDRRLYVAKEWLQYSWKHLFASDPERKPTWADVIYRGGVEALEMALRYDVDLVFIISAMYLHPDVLIMMRRAGLKTAVLFSESPYLDEEQSKIAELCDVCFTNERVSVAYLRQYNKCTFYIRHAYSPKRHFPSLPDRSKTSINTMHEWQQSAPSKSLPTVVDVRRHDVVFVGTGFRERIDILGEIDWSGIDLGLYGNWALLPSRHKLRKYLRGGVMTNMDAHELYRRSKVGLNLYRTSMDYGWKTNHINQYQAESMNPRAYELAASGIFSITQRRIEGEETLAGSQPFFTDSEGLQFYLELALSSPEFRMNQLREALERIQGQVFLERAKQVLSYGLN